MFENARRVDEDGQHECPVCGADAPYVLYDGDKMCVECGHVPGVGGRSKDTTEWQEWLSHRDNEYSGWHGPERIKFVGGFASAYVFEEDF